MYDAFLGIRSSRLITHGRTSTVSGGIRRSGRRAVTKTIVPRVPYLVLTGVVALEVVDEEEITRIKAPYAADPWPIRIDAVDLVDAPVIRGIPGKLAGVVALRTQQLCALVLG